MSKTVYAGFWIRFGATIIDTILLILVIGPILTLLYGASYWSAGSMAMGPVDVLLSYVLPVIVVIGFWIYRSATPGKMLTHLTIVDANTGGKPTTGKFILRYFGYLVSSIPFCLGFLWVAFDKRKQGFHDKIAGTVVIRSLDDDEWDDPDMPTNS